MPEPIIMCEVCGEEEVDEPAIDWCCECDRYICLDCLEWMDEENGNRTCKECAAKLKASWQKQKGGA